MPAAYTGIEAHRHARCPAACLTGHAYDISEGGVRIELDEPLQPGEPIDVRLSLPGETSAVAARANVVWVNDELDDPGPRRMALRFADFESDADRLRLCRYLEQARPRLAA